MVASEPLTFEKGERTLRYLLSIPSALTFSPCPADWMEIKTNTLIVITPKVHYPPIHSASSLYLHGPSNKKMNILQIPIVDEFHVPASDPASTKRDAGFAAEKGLWNPRKSVKVA
jgi:hypothetical protein